MPLLFAEDGSNTSARNLGFKNMNVYVYLMGFAVGLIIAIIMTAVFSMKDSNSLTLVGQYTVYNYTTSDGAVKIFLLSKDRLNQSVLLTNENDITEKILVTRIPY